MWVFYNNSTLKSVIHLNYRHCGTSKDAINGVFTININRELQHKFAIPETVQNDLNYFASILFIFKIASATNAAVITQNATAIGKK